MLKPSFRDCERARREIPPTKTVTDNQQAEWQIGRDVLTQGFRLYWTSTVTVDVSAADPTVHAWNALTAAGRVELAYSAGGKKKSLRIFDAYFMTAHRRKYAPPLDNLTDAEVQADGTVYLSGFIDLDLATLGLLPEFPGLCVPRQQDFVTITVTAGDMDDCIASNAAHVTSITQSITYKLERHELRAQKWNAQGYGSFNEFSGRFPALTAGLNNRITLPVGYPHRSIYLFARQGATAAASALTDAVVDRVRVRLNGSDYRFDQLDIQIRNHMQDCGFPIAAANCTGIYVIEFGEIDQLPNSWGSAIDATNSSLLEVEVECTLGSTVHTLDYTYSYLELSPA